MKKRIYRKWSVNDFQPQTISHADLGGKLVFAVDIAKVDMVAAFAAGDGRVCQTVSWKAPQQNPTVKEKGGLYALCSRKTSPPAGIRTRCPHRSCL